LSKANKKVIYDKTPIIEAIFEIYFPPVVWSKEIPLNLDKELKQIQYNFGTREEVNFHTFNIDLQAGASIKAEQKDALPRIRHWSADRKTMFQYGPDMIAVNALPEYQSIEDYLPLLKSVVDVVLPILGVKTITALGQRFINEITSTDEMAPEKIFAIYPKLPEHVRSKHSPFALQVETLRDDTKTVALNLEYRGNLADSHKYLLDIYLRSLRFSYKTTDDIIQWMNDQHGFVVETFEAALTKDGQKFCGKRQ